jgi:hypothetical protein
VHIKALSLMTSRDCATSFSTLVLRVYGSNTPVTLQLPVCVVTIRLLSDRHHSRVLN